MFSVIEDRQNNAVGRLVSSFPLNVAAIALVVIMVPRSIHRLGKPATDARQLSCDGANGLHCYGGVESTQA
jgi:hypothetical protein